MTAFKEATAAIVRFRDQRDCSVPYAEELGRRDLACKCADVLESFHKRLCSSVSVCPWRLSPPGERSEVELGRSLFHHRGEFSKLIVNPLLTPLQTF